MPDDIFLERLSANLALNLRRHRAQRGLTQARLGALCGVPRSTLANLEAGGGNPTLAVLAQLGAALQISLQELLAAPAGLGRHYPAGALPQERKGTGGRVVVQQLLPDPVPGMEIQRMALAPGAVLPGVPHHLGTKEYLFCEQGALVLRVAGERFELEAGDVCAFRGDQGHSYRNTHQGPTVAFGVVVLTTL